MRGKGVRYYSNVILWQDHPRLCGEKLFCLRQLVLVLWITPAYAGKSGSKRKFRYYNSGSPPPMRGKVIRILECAGIIGITPAYAGKRSSTICTLPSARDHPRLCGEKR